MSQVKKFSFAILAFTSFVVSTVAAQQQTSPQNAIRVSEAVLRKTVTHQVDPIYPAIAKAARASGKVVVEVVVSDQGQIDSVQVISGHPLLRDAAYQAAKEWKFRPTEANGKPIRIIGTLSFVFDTPLAKDGEAPNSQGEKSEVKEPSDEPIQTAQKNAARALYDLAFEFSSADRYEESIKPFKLSIEFDPTFTAAYNDLGWAYIKLQLIDDAIEIYQKLILLKPNYALGHHNLGWAYFKRGYFGDAIDSYQKLLQLNPEYHQAANIYSEIALCYAELNNLPEALKAFDQSVKLKPNDPAVVNNFGYFLAERGEKLDLALELLLKSLKMDETNGHTLDSVGWAYFKQGNLEQAEHYLKEAERYNSREPTVHEHLGDLLQKRGQAESAMNAWQKALSFATQSVQRERLRQKLGLR